MNKFYYEMLLGYYSDFDNNFLIVVCENPATDESYFAAFEVLRERGYFVSEEYDKTFNQR